MSTTSPTQDLAGFVANLVWSEVPDTARRATRRTVANVTGLAIGAAHSDPVEVAILALRDLGLEGGQSVFGRPERLPGTSAAYINGMAAHVEDYDDTYLSCILHPGAPIVPAALSAAEIAGADGATTLTAVVAGVEVASRLGDALGASHFDRGWHVTGTTGTVGAACAAARVLGLDPERTVAAMALAATQAAGHTEQLGSMAKSIQVGRSAANGLEAALLARRGFTAPPEPLAGRRGMAALMTQTTDWSMLRDLGSTWLVEANALKPYSCGIVSHGVIDAAIALRDRISTPSVEEVTLDVHPRVLDVMGVQEPESGLRSKFSVYHCFAVGLLDGLAGPGQFSDERSQDRSVVDLRRRVNVHLDPSVPTGGCRARVRLTSGEVVEQVVNHSTGSAERPMSDNELRAKFDDLLPTTDTDRVWALAHGLDELDDVGLLFAAAR